MTALIWRGFRFWRWLFLSEKTLVILDPTLRRGFTSIPNCVLRAQGLSLAAKALYAILLSFAWDGECFPGKQALAQAAGVDVRTVRKYLVELREYGLISWVRRGLNQTNVYYVHDLRTVDRLKLLILADRKELSDPDRNGLSDQDRNERSDKEYSHEHVVVHGNSSYRCAEAIQVIRKLTSEDPPADVIEEIARYDDETVAEAVAAVQQYAERNRVDNLYGLLLEALRGAWKPGPQAGPTRAGKISRGRGPRNGLTDEERKALRSLYL